jgi:hypothetical protein
MNRDYEFSSTFVTWLYEPTYEEVVPTFQVFMCAVRDSIMNICELFSVTPYDTMEVDNWGRFADSKWAS